MSLIIFSVTTFLWSFLSVIEKSKPLKKIISTDSLPFLTVWVLSLLLTGIIWYYTNVLEKKMKRLKKTIISTQPKTLCLNYF